MLGGLGPLELIIILAVVLIIFGPKNLPKLGASIGKTVKNFREGMAADESGAQATAFEAQDVVEVAADGEDVDQTA